MPHYDFNLSEELNMEMPYADSIVRINSPRDEQLRSLEEIIYAETNRAIRYESHGPELGWMKDPAQKREELDALLDNLAKTTSLQFKVERRPAQIWFVTETKNN